jgi:4-hydroxybutyrate CoA-transferase
MGGGQTMSEQDRALFDRGGMAWADDESAGGGDLRRYRRSRSFRAGAWLDDYRQKTVSPEVAVRNIRSGQSIYYSGNAACPFELITALAAQAPELSNVTLNHVLLLGEDPLSAPGMEGHFRHNSMFVGPADRGAVNDGRADYTPIFLHQIPRLFRERIVPIDVALIQVSPPDAHGYMSLGVEILASHAACHTARFVIVQVNDRMPRVLGDASIHVSQVDAIVEVSRPLPELEASPATDIERAIGQNVADLIEDGACLQLGIGGIPDAVLSYLEGKRNIGIHTEMVSDGIMEAVEKGIITCVRKNYHHDKIVLTFALGSHALYDYLHDNPLFEGHPTEWVNDPWVIARNDNMVAINSAIEVDLTGQVCSDSIGPQIYSGFGGQVDFMRGAARSRGGKPIIALPSTARRGTVSRIAPLLKEGAGVVTSRADVHYVVTEYGTAHLFGKSLRQRAEALIAIAHPDFRDELEYAARERKLLP